MNSSVFSRTSRGYTVTELLVVISIIALLFSLIGVVAFRARAKARVTKTKALIKRIQLGMDAYHAYWRDYPAGSPTFPETWPNPYDPLGVEFEAKLLTEREPPVKFEKGDYDPKDDKYLVDAWGNRIRYRKVSTTRMLVWSIGPDGIDQIGNDTAKRRERIPDADDLSHVESDY